MDPETTAPPPEARLIRVAREARGLTAAAAADATEGISATYWRDVERGTGFRRGKRVPVRASDRLIAHMARTVGLSPDRLETEGDRPEAAGILREILRSENPGAGAPSPADEPAWIAWTQSLTGEQREQFEEATALFGDDSSLIHLWLTPGLPREARLALVKLVRSQRQGGNQADGGQASGTT